MIYGIHDNGRNTTVEVSSIDALVGELKQNIFRIFLFALNRTGIFIFLIQ